jgi:hypothetical protein
MCMYNSTVKIILSLFEIRTNWTAVTKKFIAYLFEF